MLDVQSGRGYCVCTTASHVVVGCGDGVIRLFDPLSLDYTLSLPRPHCLGVELTTSKYVFDHVLCVSPCLIVYFL